MIEEGEGELDGGMNRRKEGIMRRQMDENKCRKRNEVGRGRRKEVIGTGDRGG